MFSDGKIWAALTGRLAWRSFIERAERGWLADTNDVPLLADLKSIRSLLDMNIECSIIVYCWILSIFVDIIN